jgi:TolB protein
VENGLRFSETEELQELQGRLSGECGQLEAEDAIADLGGIILYSTGGEGTPYTIYRLPITEGGAAQNRSVLVMGNASQPALSQNGSMLAYYSSAAGADGLYVIGMNVDLTTFRQPVRWSPNPEDSRDSPPSWNPSGTQLVYSTLRGEDAPRLYITDASMGVRDMGLGKDPAWSPNGDVIVFQGPDAAGNPGLRAMTPTNNGADRWELTTNGNDQRPVWTPDGKYIIFMSQDRVEGTSWEVYRMEWPSGKITLLTDGATSQEGLPAVSPDNQWVAFVSDRGGTWNLYYVSIDGGPVRFLSALNGQPVSWLEHSIQWVK